MLIKRITCNDFRKYSSIEHTFGQINLISGTNGAGKSTLALYSVLFAIYGYSKNKLEQLCTRGLANPKTWVEVELEYLGNTYIIKRSIPTKIDLTINGIPSTLANNQLKQAEIEKVFGNVDFFKKFRVIDIKESSNILEQSQANLRKTLVNLDEALDLTNVRAGLSVKKADREKYNKDTSVIYKHYPSEHRKEVLEFKLQSVNDRITDYDLKITENEFILNSMNNKVGKNQWQKTQLIAQKNKLLSTNCHACGQPIKINKQQELLSNTNKELLEVNEMLNTLQEEVTVQKEVINHLKSLRINLIKQKDKLLRLQNRLEVRLRQKEYIWSTSDVEVIKQAIKEVDGFSTYYITERLKMLEPLINNILNKVGFTVKFDITDKSKFDVKIYHSDQEYSYNELSNGELLLVGIAFQLALLMEKNQAGVIIADEGFSSLSAENLDKVFDLFINSPFQLISIVHRYDTNNINVKNIVLA